MSGAFTSEGVTKKSADFICVKGNQKLANQLNVKGAPMVVIVDSDGQELGRASLKDELSLTSAWETALGKYSSRPITWGSELSTSGASKKLLVVGFDAEGGEGLKVLEDRMIAKLHGRCDFVKLPYEKDSDTAKRWGVTTAPTIVLCDPSKETPEKNPLEKIAGKKAPATIKAALLKALQKVEGKK